MKRLICIALSAHWLLLSAAACAHMAGSAHHPSESMHVHSAAEPHHQSADFHHELADEFSGEHDSAPSGAQPAPEHSSDVHCFTLIPSADGLPGAVSQVALYARYESQLAANPLSPPVPPPDL